MFLEMHLLQNFVLSNLNRDDTGAPKSCIFGGVRRARISSQCLKRAVRTYFREQSLVPSELLSDHTKWLHRELKQRLESGLGKELAEKVATRALILLDFELKDGKTLYLLILRKQEIDHLATLCIDHKDELLADSSTEKKGKKMGGELTKLLLTAINGGDAIDIALFGRMIADHAEKNVDAAVQMAHAFSTHAISTEFDYYSAVEELPDEAEGSGAAMIGTILYNSSCYYRYANLDLAQLIKNLDGNRGHVELATRAFLEGMIHAIPTGKKTSSAPQNPPSFIMVVLREKGLWSLANAFVAPIFPHAKGDLVKQSAQRLIQHWTQLAGLYGTEGICYAGVATHLSGDELALREAPVTTVEPRVPALTNRVMQEIQRSLS